MKKFTVLASLLVTVASTNALAKINIDTKYSCRVVDSNNKNLPRGSITRGSTSLRTVAKSGTLFFGNSADAIDLYSPLEFYDAFAANSGYVVLATDPTEDKEVQGSILVSESGSKSLELSITVLHTTRVFHSSTGKMAFISHTQPAIYKLVCNE